MKAMYLILGGLFVLIIGIIGMAIYEDCISEKIEIRKDQWRCTRTTEETNFIYAGTAMMPITSEVCVEYKRS